MRRFFKNSVRRQIIIGVSLTHAVLILFFVFDMVSRQNDFLHKEYKETAMGLAQALAANSAVWTLSRDYSGLQEVVLAQMKYPNVKMAMVYGLDGKILAHTEPDKIGLFVDTVNKPQLLSQSDKDLMFMENDSDSISAVRNIESNGVVLGKVWIVLTEQRLHNSLYNIVKDGILYSLMAISIGAVFALVVTTALTKRLKKLVRVAEGVKRGEKNLRVRLGSSDELGQLADAFDSMLESLELKQKKLEKSQSAAKAANQAKSDFLANMSHEIRTPINTMVGMADVLADTSLTDEQHKYVQIFQRAGENLTNLVNDILDLSKIEAGELKIKNESFSVPELFGELSLLYAESGSQKNLQLEFVTHTDLPKLILGDKDRVRQVLMNFVSNALKFTEKGGVKVVAYKDYSQQSDSPLIKFSVEDTGIGIPHDKQNILFERFQQVDTSSSRKVGGTGLGLAISKKLVELMGGKIGFQSLHTKGSKFFFILPLQEAFENEKSRFALSRHNTAPVSISVSESKSILLVDDSDDNRLLVKAYLKDKHLKITECANGMEAIEVFRKGQFDLVLLDLQMPVMDGYETVRLMREWESNHRLKNTPVIALSADSIPELVDKALRAGCDSHVSKPVRKKTLIEVVERTVSEPPV